MEVMFAFTKTKKNDASQMLAKWYNQAKADSNSLFGDKVAKQNKA